MRGIFVYALGLSVALAGCSGAESAAGNEAQVGSESQAVWGSNWADLSGHATTAVRGIARGPATNAHIWFSDGTTCQEGTFGQFCASGLTSYSCGTESCADIRGIGIAQNTSHVYSWFQDGTVMEGVVENLSFYHQYLPGRLKLPINPMTGQLFRMNDMLDGDFSPNGEAYFYWRDPGSNKVFRTTGHSDDATLSSPQVVTVLAAPVLITAISFNNFPNHFDEIETWYTNHRYNSSSTSLILTQN